MLHQQFLKSTWFVPLNFLNDALAPIYHERLELRQTARLLLVGDVSVPRISGRYRHRGQSGQLSLEITPETAHLITEESGRIFVGFDSDAIEITRHPQARGETIRDITVSQSPPGLFLGSRPLIRFIQCDESFNNKQFISASYRVRNRRTKNNH